MCHIIKYYISTQIFSLSTFNIRTTNFNYDPIKIGNVSPEITEMHLNKFLFENVCERDDDICAFFFYYDWRFNTRKR